MKLGPSDAYLQFLSRAQSIQASISIDPMEERMLSQLAGAWHENRQVSVLQAMRMTKGISSTTAHRRLKSLRRKGVIELVADNFDNRVKYVCPTEATRSYFSRMSRLIQSVSSGSSRQGGRR